MGLLADPIPVFWNFSTGTSWQLVYLSSMSFPYANILFNQRGLRCNLFDSHHQQEATMSPLHPSHHNTNFATQETTPYQRAVIICSMIFGVFGVFGVGILIESLVWFFSAKDGRRLEKDEDEDGAEEEFKGNGRGSLRGSKWRGREREERDGREEVMNRDMVPKIVVTEVGSEVSSRSDGMSLRSEWPQV